MRDKALGPIVGFLGGLLQQGRGIVQSTFSRAEPMVRPAVAVACYLGLCVLLQTISPEFHVMPREWSWSLAGGLSFGFLIAFGLAYTPVVFLGYLLPLIADGSAQTSAWTVVIFAVTNAFVYGFAWYAARRASLAANLNLKNYSNLAVMLTLIPFTALLAALASTLRWWFLGVLLPGTFVESLLTRVFGTGMGLLLAGSFVILVGVPSLNVLTDLTHASRLVEAARHRIVEVMFGVALFIAAAAGSAFALSGGDTDRFERYLLVFAPLIAVAFKFGLEGLAAGFLVVGCTRSVMELLGYSVADGFGFEITLLAAFLSSLIVASLVTDRKQGMRIAGTQAALMDAVAYTTQQALRPTNEDKDLNVVLERLVTDLHAARLFVMEYEHRQGETEHRMHYEYCKPGVSEEEHAEVKLQSVRNSLIGEHEELLKSGEAVQCVRADLTAADQAVLEALNIHTSVVIPIFDEDRWWGCLGVERTTDAVWSTYEVSTLRAAVGALGAFLSHSNVEDQLRQFAGNIPAAFWIGKPNGLQRTYVSPAFERIWGISADNIRDEPQAWMGRIHHEDLDRLREELPKQNEGEYDVEYRILLPDGSVRWVTDTAFPVRNAFGTVSRIVGVAQDITRQKEVEDRAEEQIWTTAKEREISYKEIHHQVKNNLELISSLLSLRATQIGDEQTLEAIRDGQNRVKAMAVVHDQLYRAPHPGRINFSGYTHEVIRHLIRTYQPNLSVVQLQQKVEPVELDIDTTILCGLIISELVSNSLKHAFPKDRTGRIELSLSQDDTGKCQLVVRDDGVGFPPEQFHDNRDLLGLRLVRNLVERLNGHVQYSNEDGARYSISFRPLTDAKGYLPNRKAG